MLPARIATLAAVSLLVSCVPSLHPLIAPSQSISDPRLPGLWIEEDGAAPPKETYEIRPSGKQYVLIHTEGKSVSRFRATLGKIGPHHFLDCTPEPDSFTGTELLKTTSIPAHLFFLVRFESGKPRLNVLNPKWLQSRLKSGQVKLSHVPVGEGPRASVLLLASTQELQTLVAQYANDAEAFSLAEPLKLKKR